MAAKEKQPSSKIAGERIAKVLSRAGISSRREAERLIELGEVKVNGKTITSPALNVLPSDKITVQGEPVGQPEPARLWLYYKPDGLVSTNSDEKGRDTVFDHLPEDLPRVMTVGRLDLNSEGLLLLTNDGELKRRLELPSTGWLRKYRVRVKGNPTDPELEPLRKGIVLDGERFQPMSVQLDRHQGANAWLTVGLREGKNREIRRAIDSIGLIVNRLIRISYGPFRLGDLEPGQVEEVRAKTLREQLGEGKTDDATEAVARKPRPATTRPSTPRTRAGDGIKALAKAWDDATAPKAKPNPRARSLDDARPKRDDTPRRTVTTRSRASDEDRPKREDTPRRTVTTRSRASDEDRPKRDDAPRRTVTTRSRASDEDRPKREDAPRRTVTTRSRASDEDRPARPVAKSARDDAPRRAGSVKPAAPKPAKAAPKASGKPAIAGPRKAPSRPLGKPPAKPKK